MPLIPAKCTQCGANITVDDTKEAGICESCGTPFVTEKTINNYKITNTYSADVINVYNAQNEALAPIIKRIFMLIEDGEFKNASVLCEKALNQNPENAELYLAKLMIEQHAKCKEELVDCATPFDNSNNYKKVVRFADSILTDELNGYIDVIKNRNEQQRREQERITEQLRQEKARKAKKTRKIIAFSLCSIILVITFIFAYQCVIIPNKKYNDAVNLMEDGRYKEAITEFKGLNGFRNSDEKITECQEKITERYISVYGDLWYDVLCKETGTYITFGTYEQDNNTNSKEDIEWLILVKEDSRMLVVSKYALDCKPFDDNSEFHNWENSSLRKWLNTDFYDASFSENEKKVIATTTVNSLEWERDGNKYERNPEKTFSVQDKTFVLSQSEANTYLSNDTRICHPTAYAVANGAWGNNGYCCWWTRTWSDGLNAVVDNGDCVSQSARNDSIAVRPAMWIDWSLDNYS